MIDFEDKKLKPVIEFSRNFLEKYMDQGQFDRNNHGDQVLGNSSQGEPCCDNEEEMVKAMKRMKKMS
jgi:hypothetical protein